MKPTKPGNWTFKFSLKTWVVSLKLVKPEIATFKAGMNKLESGCIRDMNFGFLSLYFYLETGFIETWIF